MVILPDAVEAAERARPVVPSATHAAGATDQPSGSAAVSAVQSAEMPELRDAVWTKSESAPGPPQISS